MSSLRIDARRDACAAVAAAAPSRPFTSTVAAASARPFASAVAAASARPFTSGVATARARPGVVAAGVATVTTVTTSCMAAADATDAGADAAAATAARSAARPTRGDLSEMQLHFCERTKTRIRCEEGVLRLGYRRSVRAPVRLLRIEQDMGTLRQLRQQLEALMTAHVRDLVARMGCHGMPERCLRYRGAPMPICARCFGVAVGQTVGACLYFASVRVPVAWCIAGALVMLVDWSAQEYLGRTSTNPRRVITGLLAGDGLGTLYCYALAAAWHAITG